MNFVSVDYRYRTDVQSMSLSVVSIIDIGMPVMKNITVISNPHPHNKTIKVNSGNILKS